MVFKLALPSFKGPPVKQNTPAKFHHEHMPLCFSGKMMCQKHFSNDLSLNQLYSNLAPYFKLTNLHPARQ
jgi:hypothetical protein